MSDRPSLPLPLTENTPAAEPFLRGQRCSDGAVGSQRSSVGSGEDCAIMADTLVGVAASSSDTLKLGSGVVNTMPASGNP